MRIITEIKFFAALTSMADTLVLDADRTSMEDVEEEITDDDYEVLVTDSILKCSICHDYLLQPVTTPCGHTFCKRCLIQWMNSQRGEASTCPSCRYNFPGSYDRRFIEACKPDMLSNHILESTCYIPCHNGCSSMIHPGAKETHDKECSEALVSCINEHCGCRQNIKRKSLIRHLGECRFFHCKARLVGCQRLGTEAEITEHERSCQLKLIKDYIDKRCETLSKGPIIRPRRGEVVHPDIEVGIDTSGNWPTARRVTPTPHSVSRETSTGGVVNMTVSHVNTLGSLAHELSEFLER